MPLLASAITYSMFLLCPSFFKNRTKTMVELCAKFVESVEVVESVAVVQLIGALEFFSKLLNRSIFNNKRDLGDIKFCVYTR